MGLTDVERQALVLMEEMLRWWDRPHNENNPDDCTRCLIDRQARRFVEEHREP
jgi:hypothetical protein